jgi:hypothetical protein
MTPLTPTKMYDGRLAIQLPPKLLPAFLYLSEVAMTHPEIAGFPTFFLSAWAGNEAAIQRVFEVVFVVHWACVHHARNQDQKAISNAIVFLGNKLAENIQNEKENPAPPEHPPAPVTKAEPKQEKRPRPAPVFGKFSRKPGMISSEKN